MDNLKEILKDVDKEELSKALNSKNPDELKALFAKKGITLDDEQLDYIAGGSAKAFTC